MPWNVETGSISQNMVKMNQHNTQSHIVSRLSYKVVILMTVPARPHFPVSILTLSSPLSHPLILSSNSFSLIPTPLSNFLTFQIAYATPLSPPPLRRLQTRILTLLPQPLFSLYLHQIFHPLLTVPLSTPPLH